MTAPSRTELQDAANATFDGLNSYLETFDAGLQDAINASAVALTAYLDKLYTELDESHEAVARLSEENEGLKGQLAESRKPWFGMPRTRVVGYVDEQ